MKKDLHIVHGPNLQLLGQREAHIYGKETFDTTLKTLQKQYSSLNIHFFCSNYEGALIDYLHQSVRPKSVGLLLNAGALSHYSIALRDALTAIDIPVIEIHLSNIYAREDFRHKSVLSAVVKGVVVGLGTKGYEVAIQYLLA